MTPISISLQALRRLPVYLQYLKKLQSNGATNITATAIAAAMHLNEIQVRKDIAAVSRRPGKPMVGFDIKELINDISCFLSYDNLKDAVLVGAGTLGRALLGYSGFAEYGMNIVAAFDSDPALAGQRVGDCEIYPMSELCHICARLSIMIGIITVPAENAQQVCDQMVRSGILAIWNFAPVFLDVPDDILVQNENMASSLAVLSRRLYESGAMERGGKK